MALTNPAKYAEDRAKAFGNMKKVVTESYTTAFNEFIKAGYPADSAEGSALTAAEQTRRVQRLIIEQQFPSAANAIGDARTVQTAGAFAGTLGGTAARQSAPRRASGRTAAQRSESARKAAATRAKKAKAKKKK